MTRTPEQAADWARARLGHFGWDNLCLSFVRQSFDVYYTPESDWPSNLRYAGRAWDLSKFKHRETDPTKIPFGVPVFFELATVYDHVVFSTADGDAIGNDFVVDGRIDYCKIGAISDRWGPLLGWTEDLVGNRVWSPPKPPKPPTPPHPKRSLNLGLYNMLRGRDAGKAVDEVAWLAAEHSLDVVAVNEAEGYHRGLDRLTGFDYFAAEDNAENAVLVRKGRGGKFHTEDVGDGWIREGGAKRGPGEFPRVVVDDWAVIGVGHWPPGTYWKNGRLVAPPERVDDTIEWAEASVDFLQRGDEDGKTRVMLSDFNERAASWGQYSPQWVARQAGADICTTGGIDYGLAVRGDLRKPRKITGPRLKSDHPAQVMELVET